MAIALTHIGSASSKASPASLTITVPVGGVPTGACIFVLSSLQVSNSAEAMLYNVGITTGTANTYQNPASLLSLDDPISFVSTRVNYAYNCVALSSGDTIQTALDQPSVSCSSTAFYATGLSTSDPLDTATTATLTQTSGDPSRVQMAAAPAVAGSLVLGTVSYRNVVGAFTQDSINAAYGTPPTIVGTAGQAAATNNSTAGGTVISSAQLTYAPDFLQSFGQVIAAFAPASEEEPSTPDFYFDIIS